MFPTRLDVKDFLGNYWQKQPQFFAQAFEQLPQIDKKYLFALAREENVFSRIILTPNEENQWQSFFGPFTKSDWQEFSNRKWTLLINQIENYHFAYLQLIEHFRFIPNWRIDDVMLSYSCTGGSVGPHQDNYDVFLIQAEGNKTWQIELQPNSELIDDLDVKILKTFSPTLTWHAQPGDMIYLPPGVGHYGVAEGEGATISIGFRMPRISDIIANFFQHYAEQIEDQWISDADLKLQQHCGEISQESLQKIFKVIQSITPSEQDCKSWFGEYITDSSIETFTETNTYQQFLDRWKSDTLLHNEGCHFAFINSGEQIEFYAAGEKIETDPGLENIVIFICDNRTIEYKDRYSDEEIRFLHQLYEKSYLQFISQIFN